MDVTLESLARQAIGSSLIDRWNFVPRMARWGIPYGPADPRYPDTYVRQAVLDIVVHIGEADVQRLIADAPDVVECDMEHWVQSFSKESQPRWVLTILLIKKIWYAVNAQRILATLR